MSGIVNALRYEQGVFTPQLKFGGGNSDMLGTYNGSYTIIDSVLIYSIDITLTAKGTSTGDATITGLPYATVNNNIIAPITFENVDVSGSTTIIAMVNGSTLDIKAEKNNAAFTLLDESDFNNNSKLYVAGSYRI